MSSATQTQSGIQNDILVGYGRSGHLQNRYGGYLKFGAENQFDGPVPVSAVLDRLFYWRVEEVRLDDQLVFLPNGTPATFGGRKGIAHPETGEIYGIFKEGYQSHDYAEWLVTNVENILDADLGIASAGLTMGGGAAWVNVALAETITLPEGVEFLPYLTAYTSHNGRFSTGYKTGIHNMVCANEMSAMHASRKGNKYTVKHTRNSIARLNDARQALGIVHGTADEFAAQVKALCETTVTDAVWNAFLDTTIPVTDETRGRALTLAENKRDALNLLWNRDDRVSPWRGTAFGVVQAVNTYTHHVQTVRGANRFERNTLSALSGDFDALDSGTLETLNHVLATV